MPLSNLDLAQKLAESSYRSKVVVCLKVLYCIIYQSTQSQLILIVTATKLSDLAKIQITKTEQKIEFFEVF